MKSHVWLAHSGSICKNPCLSSEAMTLRVIHLARCIPTSCNEQNTVQDMLERKSRYRGACVHKCGAEYDHAAVLLDLGLVPIAGRPRSTEPRAGAKRGRPGREHPRRGRLPLVRGPQAGAARVAILPGGARFRRWRRRGCSPAAEAPTAGHKHAHSGGAHSRVNGVCEARYQR